MGSFVVTHVLSSCVAQASADFSSCFTACGILVFRSGMEPMSLALQGEFIITGPPGKSLSPHFEVPSGHEVFVDTVESTAGPICFGSIQIALGDFPGGPVAKASLSNAGSVSSILAW